MLRTELLVTAIGKAARCIFQSVGGAATGPAVVVAHVGAQAGLVHHRDVFPIRMQGNLFVVRRDVGASA